MKCNQVRNHIVDTLAQSDAFSDEINLHLAHCLECQQFYQDNLLAVQSVRPTHLPEAPKQFKSELMRSIRDHEQSKVTPAKPALLFWKPVYVAAITIFILLSFVMFKPSDWFQLNLDESNIPAPFRLASAFAGELWLTHQTGTVYQSNTIEYKHLKNYYGEEEQWYPIFALNQNGEIECLKVFFEESAKTECIVKDEAWYDYDQRRFARKLSVGQDVIFYNAFDGNHIYFSYSQDDSTRFSTNEMLLPQPEEFLSLASVLSALWADGRNIRVVNSLTNKKTNGKPLQQVKVTIDKNFDEIYRYYFDLAPDTQRIHEINTYLHRQALLSIRPGEVQKVDSYPIGNQKINQDIGKQFRFETTSIQPLVKRIQFDNLIKNAWEGMLYADFDLAQYANSRIIEFKGFESSSERLVLCIYESPNSQSLFFLQSPSLNMKYGAKVEAAGQLIKTTDSGLQIWKCSILNPVASSFVKGVENSAAEQIKQAQTYLIKSPQETYALLISSELLSNDKIDDLLQKVIILEDGK